MKISNTHQSLSNCLKNPEVLTNPESFLGPNWETVLRWWLYCESLTYEQKNELFHRWCAIDRDTHNRAFVLVHNAVIKVIGVDNRDAVWYAAPYPKTITFELIAMHLLLERGHSLTFVPLVNNL
jgi:hypothetical protein